MPNDVLGGRVEHVWVHQPHLTEVSGQLDEILTLPDQCAEIELAWQDALRMVRQEACDYPARVRRNEGSAALVLHVGPQHDGKEPLLGRVQKVAEEVSVLMPTR